MFLITFNSLLIYIHFLINWISCHFFNPFIMFVLLFDISPFLRWVFFGSPNSSFGRQILICILRKFLTFGLVFRWRWKLVWIDRQGFIWLIESVHFFISTLVFNFDQIIAWINRIITSSFTILLTGLSRMSIIYFFIDSQMSWPCFNLMMI